jgi:uncharacterized cupredoxin-like copper-binding protein
MRTRLAFAVVAASSLIAACSASPGTSAGSAGPASQVAPATQAASQEAPASAGGAASAAAGAVQVTLQEWAVATDVQAAAAGSVSFTATNKGPEDTHEFVVIKTDLPLTDLPTDATGAVNEDGDGIEVIGEIEDVAVGSSKDVTLTLTPGKYVLICNIYDEAEKEAHYQMGMRTALTVT